MRRFIVIFLSLMLPCFLCSQESSFVVDQQIVKASPAKWAIPCTLDIDSCRHEPDANLIYLLDDRQVNCEAKSSFYHFAWKIQNKGGIEGLSHYEIDFDPSYEKIVLH